jgi:hypothetical protein
VINYKDDEEEREEHFLSENKEDFIVSFSTTRQRCLIQTSGEGKRYVFHYRSTDDVPKFILTNLPPCCISVKDKYPCPNSSSTAYYLAAEEDGFLYLIEGTPTASSKKALWHIGKASRTSIYDVIRCDNQNNEDSQYVTVDASIQKDVRLKLTYDGSQDAVRFGVYVNTKSGVHYQFSCNDLWIGRNEEQNPTDGKWHAVLSETPINFKEESNRNNPTFSYLTCKIPNDQGPCSKRNAMEGDRIDVLPTEEDPSDQSKYRLPLYENSAKEDGGFGVLPKAGKSSHPSEPSREIAPPGDHHPHHVRSKDRRRCRVM